MTRAIALSLLFAAATASAQQPARPSTYPLDAVVAVVGDQPITRYDLQQHINQLIQSGMPRPTTDSAKRATDSLALIEMVELELVLQKAKELKVEAPEAEISTAVDRHLKNTRAAFPNETEFRSALVKEGMGTPEEYRTYLLEQYRRQQLYALTMRKLREENKLVPVNVSPAEVAAEFEKARSFLPKKPATVTFRQIVMAPQPTAAAKEVARIKAESLLAVLKRDQDFEKLAKRESMDPLSKEIGGDMGWSRRGSTNYPPELERWLFGMYALSPGQMSPVIDTPLGFHIIRVERVQTGEVKARKIVILPKLDSSDVVRTAKLADSVATLWRNGAVFDSLTKRYHDYAHNEETSLLTPFARDSLPPTYQTAFTEKKQGDIVVFQIPGNRADDTPKFVVARLESVAEGGEQTLAEMREVVRSNLAERGAARRMIDNLKKQTYVSIRLSAVERTPGVPNP